jgi:predicted metal-binding protein
VSCNDQCADPHAVIEVNASCPVCNRTFRALAEPGAAVDGRVQAICSRRCAIANNNRLRKQALNRIKEATR